MKTRTIQTFAAALALSGGLALFSAGSALAASCIGTCGTIGANGDVTAPTGTNSYISTYGGTSGGGSLGGSLASSQTGSTYTTSTFAGGVGDTLNFFFNYVTSDGNEFVDYSWVELQTSAGAHVAWLYSGRTTNTGNTVPGAGMPSVDATLSPAGAAIGPGTGGPDTESFGGAGIFGPVWSPLGAAAAGGIGGDGRCWSTGCGLTGWVQSTYELATAGTFVMVFGVQNWLDDLWDSGLAWYGAKITNPNGGETEIDPVPLPAALPLLAGALGGLGLVGRWRKRRQAKTAMA